MQKRFHTLLAPENRGGNLRPAAGASVTVTDPNGALATIYSDNGVTVAANPLTSSATGYYEYYAADGRYTETITKTGRDTVTISDILLEDPADSPSPTTADIASTADSKGAGLVGFLASAEYAAGTVGSHLQGADVAAPARRGFWVGEGDGANVHRFRDRLFVGDAVDHTGRRTAPYGDTWLAQNVATWPEKNAQAIVLSSESRIGLLGGAHVADGSSITGSCVGIAAFTYNGGVGSTSRGFYADATLAGTDAAAVYGLEVAVSNRGADVSANSYGFSAASGIVMGMHLTPEGGSGYTIGDTDTPAPIALYPAACAINIAAGSGGTAHKRWTLGIRFSSSALSADGSGNAVAVSMAQGHTLEWMASSAIAGARIRSKVTAVAGQDVGILFENNLVSVKGSDLGATIADFSPVASGVNNIRMTNAVTGGFPIISATGADTNVGMFFNAKGSGNYRFRTNAGLNEQFRVSHTASAVNYLSATGAIAGGAPRLDALGSDTDIDIAFTPKGAGNLTLPVGNFRITELGKGLRVKEGSNAKQGVATLAAGTVTVANTSVTANSRIFLTVQSLGTVTAPKAVAVTARTAGASFTITSEDATDTSVVAYQIFEPA